MTPAERQSYRRACRSFDRGDDAVALSEFTRLLRTRRGYADVHYKVGVLQERKNDLDSAGRSLREALRINPSYAEALLALASVYERQGDFARSREVTERARAAAEPVAGGIDSTTRGKLANLQAELGDAFHQAGELRDAIEAYRKALDRCPDFHDIRLRLGIALREAGLPAGQSRLSRRHRGARTHALHAGAERGGDPRVDLGAGPGLRAERRPDVPSPGASPETLNRELALPERKRGRR
jgi:tetratricopeptide (TPR) repeat protein